MRLDHAHLMNSTYLIQRRQVYNSLMPHNVRFLRIKLFRVYRVVINFVSFITIGLENRNYGKI